MHWPKQKLFLNHMRKDWGICFPRGMHWIWLVWEGFILNISGVHYVVVSPYRQTQPIRNIAEELDPTFKARKRESLLMGNSAPSGQSQNCTPFYSTSQHYWAQLLSYYPSSSFFPCTPQVFVWPIEPLTLCSMTTCQSPHSSLPPNAKVTNQDVPKPKRRRRTASSSEWNITQWRARVDTTMMKCGLKVDGNSPII